PHAEAEGNQREREAADQRPQRELATREAAPERAGERREGEGREAEREEESGRRHRPGRGQPEACRELRFDARDGAHHGGGAREGAEDEDERERGDVRAPREPPERRAGGVSQERAAGHADEEAYVLVRAGARAVEAEGAVE